MKKTNTVQRALRTVVALAISSLAVVAHAAVSPSGAYETGFRFEVPAYYGLEPTLGLSYSSTAGNGPVGLGWRLAAGSTIHRVSSTYGAPRMDATDIFFVDGQELVPCAAATNGPSCVFGGATHTFRIESYQRVVLDPTGNAWTITGRDGTQHHYVAQLGASRGWLGTYNWTLDRVVDTSGHVIDYATTCDSSGCYLRAINYGDGEVCDATHDGPPKSKVPGARITLAWEPRTDVVSVGTGDPMLGFEQTALRLASITVAHAGGLVRTYKLEYVGAIGTWTSLLHAVREVGSDGITEAPVRSFTSPAMSSPMAPIVASTSTSGGAFNLSPVGSANQILPLTWTSFGSVVPWLDQMFRLYKNHVFADVDGDGRADLVQWQLSPPYSTIEVMTRVAGGTDVTSSLAWNMPFADGYGCNALTAPQCFPATNAHAVDIDGDGLRDLVFENWIPTGNGGTGNAELRLELVTLRATGGGKFDAPVMSTTGVRRFAVQSPVVCATGDVDGDHRADFVCTSQNSTFRVITERSDGNGHFAETAVTAPGAVTAAVLPMLVLADVNDDGRDDPIFVANSGAPAGQPGGNCTNNGTFCPHWEFTTGLADGTGRYYAWEVQITTDFAGPFPWRQQVLTGDLDGDARADLVITNQGATASRITVVRNLGSGTMRWKLTAQDVTGLSDASELTLGDTDNDGISELLVAYYHVNKNVYCGDQNRFPHYEVGASMELQSNGTFFANNPQFDENFQCPGMLIEGGQLASVDVNGDGRTDWVGLASPGAGTYVVIDQPAILRDKSKREWRRADVNGDGREDWVAVTYANPGIEVHTVTTQADGSYAGSTVTFAPSALLESVTADSVRSWVAADIGGPAGVPDGLTDLVIVDDASGIVTTLIAQGNGTWSRPPPVGHGFGVRRTPQRWIPLDVDGDGRTDLVRLEPTSVTQGLGHQPALAVDVLRSVGDGTWVPVSSTAFAGSVTPRLTAFRAIDFDGDHRGDLVQLATTLDSNGMPYTTIRTLRSLGDGTFADDNKPFTQSFTDVEHYVVADINGDGRGDLARLDFPPGATPTVAALLGVGDGSFVAQPIAPIADTMSPVAAENQRFEAADLDLDGRTDFYKVMIERGAGGVTTTFQAVWNRVTGFSAQPASGLGLTGTDVNTFEVGDFDGDGRPDLLRLGVPDVDRIRLAAPTTRMTEHNNGRGGRTTIAYTTSVGLTANLPAGRVLPLVQQIAVHDDTTAALLETTEYQYDDVRYDHQLHTVLGVATQRSSSGRSKTLTTYQIDDRCGARALTSELQDAFGRVISRTSNGFETDTITGKAPFTCEVKLETYDECETGPACRTTVDHVTHDLFGNVVETWEEGDITDATDDRITFSPPPVNPDYARWIVGLTAYKQVVGRVFVGGTWQWEQVHDTELTYDAAGRVTQQDDWNDQTGGYVTTELEYDVWGNVTRHIGPKTPHAPAGSTESITYDCTFHRFPVETCNDLLCGQVKWNEPLQARQVATDANHESAVMTYDPLGRLLRVDRPDGGAATWEYFTNRTRASVTDDSLTDGVFWTDTYFDGLGRAYRTVEEGGRASDVEYDGASQRKARVSSPYLPGDTPRWSETLYDAANRVIREAFPDGRARRTEHLVGRVVTSDEVGAVTQILRDGYGRIAAVEEDLRSCVTEGCPLADRYITTYGYDTLGHRIWIRDAVGNFTTSTFDSLGRRLQTCSPDSGCDSVEYADDGRPISETDAANNVHHVDYDAIGRVVARLTVDASGKLTRGATYAWDVDPATGNPIGDSRGRLVRTEEHGRYEIIRLRGYDPMGRVSSQEDCVVNQCEGLAYAYDHAGRMREITYPDLSTVDYIYDHRGLLTNIPGYATFVYDDATNAPTQAIYNNGVVERWQRDPDRLWLDQVALNAHGGTFAEHLVHDPTGRVQQTEIDRPMTTVATTYSYDDLGRLRHVASSDPSLTAAYDYDPIGNRTRDSVLGTIDYADPAHVHAATATTTGNSYTYDVLGQLVQSNDLDLEWNADGNPAVVRDRHSGATTEYGYDATGERVLQTDATGTQLTFGPLVELDPHGNLVSYIMAHGQAIARRDAGGVNYLHRDHLGSVRTVTDSSGNIVGTQDYTTWGARAHVAGFGTGMPGSVGFAGMHDDQHGLIRMGARYYDPIIGMFTSADSIVPDPYTPQTLNAYAYAMNDPATLVDPSGHAGEDGEWQHFDTEWGSLDVFTPTEVQDGASDGIQQPLTEPPPPLVGQPSVQPMTQAQWLAQTDAQQNLTDDQRDTDNANKLDDAVFTNITDPVVHRLAALPRVLAAWDPTGVMDDKLDDVDEVLGLGDSTPGGMTGRIVLMGLSLGGPTVIKNIARANQLRKLAKTGVTLEVRISRQTLRDLAGKDYRKWQKLIAGKYKKANRFIKQGLIDARIGERIPYDRRMSQSYVKLVYQDLDDVPFEQVNVTKITGNGQVDEIIARFFGGPPLDFNQHIIPGDLNGLLGGVEHAAAAKYLDGTKVARFRVLYIPRRAPVVRRHHGLRAEVAP